jgi:hypothetical protein
LDGHGRINCNCNSKKLFEVVDGEGVGWVLGIPTLRGAIRQFSVQIR